MFIGGTLGYRLLNWIKPADRLRAGTKDHTARPEHSKLPVHWGEGIYAQLAGKKVLDFGCGFGGEAIDLARRGVEVTGLDIRPAVLEHAREAAGVAGVSGRARFVTETTERFDVILSLDAFEHFEDPGTILRRMGELLRPDGMVLASFGPTWLHPLGGHTFSVFPWAHLLFTERALLRWRAGFCDDGARRFRECSGGLNQITIAGFRRLVANGPFRFASFEAVPIRGARLVHNALTRELFTSLVRCKLVLKGQQNGPGRSRPHRALAAIASSYARGES